MKGKMQAKAQMFRKYFENFINLWHIACDREYGLSTKIDCLILHRHTTELHFLISFEVKCGHMIEF